VSKNPRESCDFSNGSIFDRQVKDGKSQLFKSFKMSRDNCSNLPKCDEMGEGYEEYYAGGFSGLMY
jgi:hypothetical protein